MNARKVYTLCRYIGGAREVACWNDDGTPTLWHTLGEANAELRDHRAELKAQGMTDATIHVRQAWQLPGGGLLVPGENGNGDHWTREELRAMRGGS